MKLTKHAHSCVRLDDDGYALVIDPGELGTDPAVFDGAHAVLITHEHADHVDVALLQQQAAADPQLRIYAPPSVTTQAEGLLAERVHPVEPGQHFTVGPYDVRTFGGQHALIHPQIPLVANVGYLVNESLYHPGDSLIVPPVPVETLLVPIHAPWSKVGEIIDFVIGVRAERVHQIHDGALNETGLAMAAGHVGRFTSIYGGTFTPLRPGESA